MAKRSREDSGRFVEKKGEYNYSYGEEYYTEGGSTHHTLPPSFNLFKKCPLIQRILEKYCNGSREARPDHVLDRVNYADQEELDSNPVLREGWRIAKELKPEDTDSIELAFYLYTMDNEYLVVTKEGVSKKVRFYVEFNRATSFLINDPDNYRYKYFLFLLLAGKNRIQRNPRNFGRPLFAYRYRGCNFPMDLQPNKFFSFNHVVSTTTNMDIATGFFEGKKNPALFQIKVAQKKNSVGIKEFSQFAYEDEYIFYPDAKFVIKSILENFNGITLIDLEYCYGDDYHGAS